MTQTASDAPLLEVTDLQMRFPARRVGGRQRTYLNAVDGVSLRIDRGLSLGLVGESGCGKSTTARSIARLYEPTGGSIRLFGNDIAHLTGKPLLDVRKHVQMIFQDPYSSLNPRHTVGTIVSTPLITHRRMPRGELTATVQELLKTVGLSSEHYNRYPNEFSGGQRQRIGIARALALKPDLIVADEPVSALDVSIRAQIINLLRTLQDDFGVAFLFIAHDLMMVRHFCPQIAVMYLGKIVEYGSRDAIYRSPHHPYTQALLSAVPDLNETSGGRRERIRLRGDVPSPVDPPSGCRFRTRCWKAQDRCAIEEPALRDVGGRRVACHFADHPG